MMECPDLFPLGDRWVLLASLYKTNQWWVGSLTGDPPRFTPEQVGVLDYGNGYAAKTGSAWCRVAPRGGWSSASPDGRSPRCHTAAVGRWSCRAR